MRDVSTSFRIIARRFRTVVNSILQRVKDGTGFSLFDIRNAVPAVRLDRDFLIWFATWFATFCLTSVVGLLIIFALMHPLDLLRIEFRLYPLALIAKIVPSILLIPLLIWGYRRLRSPEIIKAQRVAGYAPPHIWGLFSGILLVTLLPVVVPMAMSVSSPKAIELARSQTGPGYKFHVTNIQCKYSLSSPNQKPCFATVQAYNENEIRNIEVRW